jgi:hypothetical protein
MRGLSLSTEDLPSSPPTLHRYPLVFPPVPDGRRVLLAPSGQDLQAGGPSDPRLVGGGEVLHAGARDVDGKDFPDPVMMHRLKLVLCWR